MARRSLRSTPAISAGAIYAAKDAVGALNTLDRAARNGGGGKILGITVVDRDNEAENLKVWIFNFAVTAAADNAAMAFSDADLAAYLVGVVDIPAANYVAIADNGQAYVPLNGGLGFKCASGSNKLYYQLEATGTPTYTAVSDLNLIFDIDSE
jgi:hypothetical protein